MITLLISALSGSFNVILSKVILTRRHVSVHVFTPLTFLFLFLITGIVVPWLGKLDFGAILQPKPLTVAGIMIVVAALWNVLHDRAVKNETLQEFESTILLVPLATTLLSALIFPQERNARLVLAALVASLALVASHIEKRHLVFNRHSRWLLLAVILIAFENIMVNYLLGFWSPATLYFARTFFIFVLLGLMAKPTFGQLSGRSVWLTFCAAAAGVVHMIALYYGYQTSGIVFTTLILVLQPVFIFLIDKLFLHDKLQPRYLIATAVIITAVIYGSVVR